MSKKKFKVEVCRTSYGFLTIEVEAESHKEASDKALDEAGDHLFSEKSSDYSTGGVTEIKENS